MSALSRGTAPFGDLDASRDSPEYARAAKLQAQGCLNSHDSDVAALERWISILREDARFRRLDDEFGHPYRSWHAFCVARQPYGLGYAPTAIDEILSERRRAQDLAADQAVAPLGPPAPERGGPSPNPSGKTKGSETTLGKERGAEYLVRRLKRDAPEVAEELARGELPSARAAAIKAGILKVPTLVQQAFRLVERMSHAERLDFDRQIRPLIAAAEAE